MDARPIGVLDSGLGGLTIVHAIRRLLPAESIVFAADSANAPYGSKSPDDVARLSAALTRFLLGQDCKLIVVACNTATVHAIARLRAAFPGVVFVGVAPVVKPLARATRAGALAVLSTPATARSAYLHELIAEFAPRQQVVNLAGDGLVELIEHCAPRALLRERLAGCLAPLATAPVDVLGLCCTHYPLLRPLVKEIVGPGVRVYDPARPVARQTRRLLLAADALSSAPRPSMVIHVSGDRARFWQAARRFAPGAVRGADLLALPPLSAVGDTKDETHYDRRGA